MPIEIKMPRLSDSMTEGKLLRWCATVGQAVREGEAIAEIEADKANMEIEALADGVLSEIVAKPGQIVPVDGTLGFITEMAGAAVDLAGDFVESGAKRSGDNNDLATQPTISPLAARLMASSNIDPRLVKGTGPGGAVTPEDVERYLAGQRA
jgi:pyruvate dehydrogenase E2 component (dihydrolipoamide acetyltransferase)